jgi:two-component system, NarL family, nitrate/nitrite response regulator NarL
MKSGSIKVAVIDDETDWLEEIGDLLRFAPQAIAVIATESNPYTAESLLTENTPDVWLIDYCMPGMDGLTLAQRLYALNPIPILLISARLLQLNFPKDVGIAGVLDKSSLHQELVPAIQQVYSGQPYISSAVQAQLLHNAESEQRQLQSYWQGLTPTEQSIGLLLTQGQTPQNIAETLCIEVSTIRWHLKNIRKKFDCTDIYVLLQRLHSLEDFTPH